MKLFKIYDGETWWVVAENDEDAVDQIRESMGMTREEYLEEIGEEPTVLQLGPGRLVEIQVDELPTAIYNVIMEYIPDGFSARILIRGTSDAWIKQGRGIVGSTLV